VLNRVLIRGHVIRISQREPVDRSGHQVNQLLRIDVVSRRNSGRDLEPLDCEQKEVGNVGQRIYRFRPQFFVAISIRQSVQQLQRLQRRWSAKLAWHCHKPEQGHCHHIKAVE